MIVGRSHISIVNDTRRSMSNHASGASAPKLNTWIVVIQIFALLIAVFLIERHLRKVEHRSRSATVAYQSHCQHLLRNTRKTGTSAGHWTTPAIVLEKSILHE